MKIIFLDIDGVLNSIAWAKKCKELNGGVPQLASIMQRDRDNVSQESLGWDPESVNILKTVLEKTDAKIVISSSWRIMNTLDNLKKYFSVFGIDCVIDVTPRVNFAGSIRGDEINLWLDTYPNDIDSFVIFDDDSDFYSGQPLIKTSYKNGLQKEHADEAITTLMNNHK